MQIQYSKNTVKKFGLIMLGAIAVILLGGLTDGAFLL